MTVAQILLVALTIVGLSLASTAVLIVAGSSVNAPAGGNAGAHTMSGDV